MTQPSATRRPSRPPRPRASGARTFGAVLAVALTIVALAFAAWVVVHRANATIPGAPSPSASASSSPSPSPLSEAQALLAANPTAGDCAVTFEGAGTLPPQLETVGQRFGELPIPERAGAVFAGWYTSEADAAAFTPAARMNAGRAVACQGDELTLTAGWQSPEAVAAADVGVPILMYHQFTEKPGGEDTSLRLNYLYIGDFDAQLGYLKAEGFYTPSWPELAAFIDGRLALPERSVVITDDDADATWHALAVPVVNKYELLTTSFAITKWVSDGTPPSPWVIMRSHTHDMHEAGANGKGRMVNWSAADIAADLETSAAILGAKEVVAYPFGHYNDTAKQGVTDAGFEMARTIEQGYVRRGTDKLALPCIRINYGESLDAFKKAVG